MNMNNAADAYQIVLEALVAKSKQNKYERIKQAIGDNERVILSNKSLTTVKPETQQSGTKPSGLWYGIGSSWLDWMQSEMPSWVKSYKLVYVITTTSDILRLTNIDQLLKFTKEYATDDRFNEDKWVIHINWERVAEQHAGIEINPYIRAARMNPQFVWYYPWDVASGCIWAGSGISSMTLLAKV